MRRDDKRWLAIWICGVSLSLCVIVAHAQRVDTPVVPVPAPAPEQPAVVAPTLVLWDVYRYDTAADRVMKVREASAPAGKRPLAGRGERPVLSGTDEARVLYAARQAAALEARTRETRALRKRYTQEREVELLRWAIKCRIEGKALPSAVIEYLRDVDAAGREGP